MKRSLRSFVVALKRTRDGEQWPSTLAITSDGRIFAPLSDSPEAVVGVVPRHTRLEYRVSEDLRFVSLYLRSTTHPRRVVAYDSETDRLF